MTIRDARSPSPTLETADDGFEEFATIEPDADDDPSFYPPPELDDYYEMEKEVPPQVLGRQIEEPPVPMMIERTPNPLYEESGGLSGDEYAPLEEEVREVRKSHKKGAGRRR